MSAAMMRCTPVHFSNLAEGAGKETTREKQCVQALIRVRMVLKKEMLGRGALLMRLI